MKLDINQLKFELEGRSAEEVLRVVLDRFGHRAALATSLGAEDQILTDMLSEIDRRARIFTLDTGRLNPETYDLLAHTQLVYGIQIEVFYPDFKALERFVQEAGINAFYESVDRRRQCCAIRKVEPLRRALSGLDLWITGLRRDQSVTRADIDLVEWDDTHGLIKLNPLLDWSEEDVKAYIKRHKVPYNRLHDQGYPSIGCQPCTRAIQTGEDIRAGRWWWENPEHKECGLHRRPAPALHC